MGLGAAFANSGTELPMYFLKPISTKQAQISLESGITRWSAQWHNENISVWVLMK